MLSALATSITLVNQLLEGWIRKEDAVDDDRDGPKINVKDLSDTTLADFKLLHERLGQILDHSLDHSNQDQLAA